MRIQPRYDGTPVLRFEGPVGDPSVPMIRQRRRLGMIFAGLDDAGWETQSRCAEWSVRDVAAHLVGVDRFWFLSISEALAGKPTRYLADFDPEATPKEGVDRMRTAPAADVLRRYLEGVDALATLVTGLDDAQWALLAETPPGHVALHSLARHALWDAWIHERDVGIPLGLDLVAEADELHLCIEYASALGPALLAIGGSTRAATLVVDGAGPDVHVVVDAGASVVVHDGEAPPDAVRLTGSTIDLVEALSCRAPFPGDVAEDDRWLVAGLRTAFEVDGEATRP